MGLLALVLTALEEKKSSKELALPDQHLQTTTEGRHKAAALLCSSHRAAGTGRGAGQEHGGHGRIRGKNHGEDLGAVLLLCCGTDSPVPLGEGSSSGKAKHQIPTPCTSPEPGGPFGSGVALLL